MIMDTAFIDGLHEELLTQIMKFVLDGIDLELMSLRDHCTVREFRARLRGVCRRWNQVVLDNPILWRDVEFISPYTYNDTDLHIEEELRRLYFTLRNGKQVSRRLAVTVRDTPSMMSSYSPPPFAALVLPAFETIRGVCGWESVSLSADSAVARSLFTPLLPQPDSAPNSPWRNLRSLTIKENWVATPSDMCPLTLSSTDAPALREVVSSVLYGDLKSWSFPWAQLTHVTLRGFFNDIADHLDILSRCTQAESTCLEQLGTSLPGPGSSSITTSVILPVKELHITFPSFDSKAPASAKMDKLITPMLTHLTLCSISWPGTRTPGDADHAVMAAERMLSRSRSSLTHLKLGVNAPGLRDTTVLGPVLSIVGSSLTTLTLCIYRLPVTSFTNLAHPFLELESLDLLITKRTTTEERQQDVAAFGQWAQTWTASLAQVVSTESLGKRKLHGKFTFASLPEPSAPYYTLHRVPSSFVYTQGRYLSETDQDSGIRGLREDGWGFNIVFIDATLQASSVQQIEAGL